MANIVVLHTMAHIFVLCSNQIYELLKRFQKVGHPKDFAMGKKFLEMFIGYYAFTGKMDSWKKSQNTWKIQFLKIPISVVRSGRSKVCVKAL